MNEKEFEQQLQALSDRVLSKALSQEEETNYTESLFESIKDLPVILKHFVMEIFLMGSNESAHCIGRVIRKL